MATSTSTPRTSTGSSAQAGSGARAIDVSALGAEALGTFVLLTVGLGAAILTGDVIGPIGVALAFGITLTGMASALGHLSGGHFNPAVTIGMAVAGRMPLASVVPYIVAQFIGGIAAAAVLYGVASGGPGKATAGGFATTGYGADSPGGYTLGSAFLLELVLTAVFVLVIALVTARGHSTMLTPLVIGLTLTSLILVAAPVTNASFNPVRSVAPALFVPSMLSEQWVFVVAPILGGAIAGLIARAWHRATDA